MSKPPIKTTAPDHRESYRIDDEVLFNYKVISSERAEENRPEREFSRPQNVELMAQLRAIDDQNTQLLQLLTQNNALLGSYLAAMSKKINVIAQHQEQIHTINGEHKQIDQHKKTRINLSEDGLNFISKRAIHTGNYLALQITFLNNYTSLCCLACVVRCEVQAEDYKIGAQFYKLTSRTQQEITREVMKAQMIHK